MLGVIAHTTMYIFKYTNEPLGFKKANLDQWMGELIKYHGMEYTKLVWNRKGRYYYLYVAWNS